MSSIPSAVAVLQHPREASNLRRLSHTARRVGRAAVEVVLFLGVGGAMVAGALLFR